MPDNDVLLDLLKRNQPYVRPGEHNYATDLNVAEPGFRDWAAKNKVPFDPNVQGPTDYDMRGFYHGLMTGNPQALSSVNPNDRRMHYSDYWKTPYHQSFSGESQWATPVAPKWNEQDQLISPGGKIVVDEKNPYPQFGSYLPPLTDFSNLLKMY
jgi:hypothetical protein